MTPWRPPPDPWRPCSGFVGGKITALHVYFCQKPCGDFSANPACRLSLGCKLGMLSCLMLRTGRNYLSVILSAGKWHFGICWGQMCTCLYPLIQWNWNVGSEIEIASIFSALCHYFCSCWLAKSTTACFFAEVDS